MNQQQYLELLQQQSQAAQQFNPASPEGMQQMQDMSNMISPKRGLMGTIGDVVQGMGIATLRGSQIPTARAYGESLKMPEEQRAAEEQKRAGIMQMLQKSEDSRQANLLRQQQMAANQAHQEASLAESSRHHKSIEGKLSKEEKQYREVERDAEALAKKGLYNVKPLSQFDSHQRTLLVKDAKEKASKGPAFEKLLKDTAKLRELVQEFPVLSSKSTEIFNVKDKGGNFGSKVWRAQLSGDKKGPKGELIRGDKYAVDLADKLVQDIIKNDAKTVPGRVTDAMLKIIEGSNVRSGMNQGAILEVLDELHDFGAKNFELSKAKAKSITGKYYFPDEDILYPASEQVPASETETIHNRGAGGGTINFRTSDGRVIPIPASPTSEADIQKLMQLDPGGEVE